MNDGDVATAEGFTIHAWSVPHSGYENAYVVEQGGLSLFFAADARYDAVFARIGERHRPRVALLPVGGTVALGRRIVMNPADALRAAADLGARTVVPIHRGGEWMSVPPLSFHPGRAEDFARLVRENGTPFTVAAPAPGEALAVDNEGEVVTVGNET
jgi:L-ascorbate metabolism protein UlaG (beta-lactamase superfamily)